MKSQLTRMASRCSRIVHSRVFEATIVVVIGANAALLCAETYPHLVASAPYLHWLELFCRAVFVIEIAIRILAYGRRPQDFFQHG